MVQTQTSDFSARVEASSRTFLRPAGRGFVFLLLGRVHGSPMGGTTGVSLEQGLGLTDISRGRPGRRPGGERSSPPDYYFIIDKINPGPHRGRLVGPLVPSS